ncbi:hypothetical protein FNF27_01972 [Cafeteria roenbergensis]|uniref:Uncharacterized protein n=1 Tax=Cafeteria roenbergensis TaxID=33653 RepID=A0A5A8ELN2_CAFRO|nr:hypothetical protein FNF27_01972 [Cafeteria roenbergensis]
MEANAPTDRPSVFLHFGVADGSSCARLERTAYNLAHFRVPDESGEAPKCEKVLPEFDLGHACKAELDCAAVVDRVDDPARRLTLSDDPGRFVCNFLAFSSMKRTAAWNAPGTAPKRLAVFCHIPALRVLGEDAGLQLALDLLDALAAEALAST